MFKIYTTDSLNLLLRTFGVNMELRYADTLGPVKKEKTDEEIQAEADAIINNIKKKVRGHE